MTAGGTGNTGRSGRLSTDSHSQSHGREKSENESGLPGSHLIGDVVSYRNEFRRVVARQKGGLG